MLVDVEVSTLVLDSGDITGVEFVLGSEAVAVALIELTGSTPVAEAVAIGDAGPAIPVVVVEAVDVGSDP